MNLINIINVCVCYGYIMNKYVYNLYRDINAHPVVNLRPGLLHYMIAASEV